MDSSERRQHEGSPIYRVPEHNLDNLKARVAKMNKRAAKLGMEPLAVSEIGEEFDLYASRDTMTDMVDMGYRVPWVLVLRQEGESVPTAEQRYIASLRGSWHPQFSLRRFVLITVTGTLPRVNGWAMAATIQHGEGGNILAHVPGFEEPLPQQYRLANTICEHCNKQRNRNDTYVLQHEDKTWKQVGRNCLADFIRSTNAAAWAESAEMLANLEAEIGEYEEDGESAGGHGQVYFSAKSLLAQVACVIRSDGWCSRTEAKTDFNKQATVDVALCLFDPKYFAKLKESQQKQYTPQEQDVARAEKAIEWAQALPSDVGNDYLWNIRVVSHRENLTHREAGLAGSIIAAYNRAMEQEVKRQYERENTLNEYFGTVGKRETYVLTVLSERDMESQYGSLTLYKFRDADGRMACWFSSALIQLKCADGETQYGLVVGETYKIKATVKKHEVYGGIMQTTLTRASVIEKVEMEVAA